MEGGDSDPEEATGPFTRAKSGARGSDTANPGKPSAHSVEGARAEAQEVPAGIPSATEVAELREAIRRGQQQSAEQQQLLEMLHARSVETEHAAAQEVPAGTPSATEVAELRDAVKQSQQQFAQQQQLLETLRQNLAATQTSLAATQERAKSAESSASHGILSEESAWYKEMAQRAKAPKYKFDSDKHSGDLKKFMAWVHGILDFVSQSEHGSILARYISARCRSDTHGHSGYSIH